MILIQWWKWQEGRRYYSMLIHCVLTWTQMKYIHYISLECFTNICGNILQYTSENKRQRSFVSGTSVRSTSRSFPIERFIHHAFLTGFQTRLLTATCHLYFGFTNGILENKMWPYKTFYLVWSKFHFHI